MIKKSILTAVWLASGLSLTGCVAPANIRSLEQRVTQLEQRLSSEALYDMLNQIQQIQTEVQQLRGEAEGLTHGIDAIKNKQKDLYLDLDQRLLALEGRQGANRPVDSASEYRSSTNRAADPSADDRAAFSEAVQSEPSPDGTSDQAAGQSPELYTEQPRVERAHPSAAAAASEQAAYDNVFETMEQGRYDAAVEQFNEFLAAYPHGEYADNAHYWLAEAYYVTRNFPAAQAGFQKVLNDYPQSMKAPDAMLKIGYIAYEQGQSVEARDKLYEVIARYPNTNAARLAQKRLSRMKQQKR